MGTDKMLTDLHKIASLSNLGKKGQIATLLILIMVVVLIFILVTVNVGRVSLQATTLANAADGGALLLASQLATKGRILSEELGSEENPKTKRCKKSNFFQSLFKIVVCTVIGFYAGGPLGAVITFGTVYYAEVMAERMSAEAYAHAAEQLSALMEYDRYREGAFYQTLLQTIDDPNNTSAELGDPYDSDGDEDTQETVPYFQYLWDRRLAKFEEVKSDLIDAINSFINGPLSVFEGVIDLNVDAFLGPISRQEVEDADGSVVELLRCLQGHGYIDFWEPGPDAAALTAWHESDCEDCDPPAGYDDLDAVYDNLTDLLGLADTLNQASASDLADTWHSWIIFLYDDDEDSDYYDILGVIIAGDDSFEGIEDWEDKIEQARDSLPNSWLAYNSGAIVITNNGADEPTKIYADRKAEFRREIANIGTFLVSWGFSLFGITCPDEGSCYDLKITKIKLSNGLIYYWYKYTYEYEEEVVIEEGPPPVTETVTKTETVTGNGTYPIDDNSPVGSGLSIPEGSLSYFTAGRSTFTSFLNGIGTQFATIDTNTYDEFDPVLTQLDNFIDDTQVFRGDIEDFYDEMNNLYDLNLDLVGLTGYNPVTYTWTDSRGEHSIEVKVGDYKPAGLRQSSSGGTFGLGKKHCLKLQDYSDDGTNCWVKVTRKDPANKNVGMFKNTGPIKWNPATSAKFTITRTGKAAYNPVGASPYVKMVGK